MSARGNFWEPSLSKVSEDPDDRFEEVPFRRSASLPTYSEDKDDRKSVSSYRSCSCTECLESLQRESRESARRNIEWLRENGFAVSGVLKHGSYHVKFSTTDKSAVMSLKEFVKSKFSWRH